MDVPAGRAPGTRRRPTVLVMATPYVLATALAGGLLSIGFEVVVPNLDAGEVAHPRLWDAVLAAVSHGQHRSSITVTLPASFDKPVMVTVGGATRPVAVAADHPIEDILELLSRHFSERA